MTERSAGGGGAGLLAGRIGGVAGSLVAGQLLIGLTYVLAARSLTPEGLGLVATCVAIGTIAAVVFDMGLSNFLLRELAARRWTQEQVRATVRTKRRAALVLVVPTMAACVLIMPTLLDGIVLGTLGWLAWEAQTANSLLRARERFTPAAGAQVTGRATGLVLTVVLIFLVAPELALAVGLVGGFAVEAGIDRVFLGSPGVGASSVRELWDAQRRASSFGLANLSAAGQQLDTPLVSLGGGLAAAGIYAAAGRLIGPLLFLSSALALVAAPWLARAHADPVALRGEERRIARFSALLAAAPLLAAVAGPFVLPWLLGDHFAESGIAFAVLAVGASLSTISQGMASVLQNRGAESSVGTAISIGLVLGLVATFVLAHVGGAPWAAAGYTLSQLWIVGHLAVLLRMARSRSAAG